MPYTFKEIDPADYYTTLTTYFRNDMAEVGHFTLLDGDLKDSSMGSGSKLNLDLLINNVIATISEYTQVDPHIGDTFSIYFRGKSPLFVNVSGTLVDSYKNYGKEDLISLYRNVLRVKAVAKTGVAPVLIFPGLAMQCAVGEMSINESSETQSVLGVTLRLIVIRLMAFSQANAGATSVMFDYTQAPDLQYLSKAEPFVGPLPADKAPYAIVDTPTNYEVV